MQLGLGLRVEGLGFRVHRFTELMGTCWTSRDVAERESSSLHPKHEASTLPTLSEVFRVLGI